MDSSLSDLQAWTGRSETVHDQIGATPVKALNATLDHPAMDANAERVIARVFAISDPLPGSKGAMRAALQALVPQKRAGDFAQALMDLGSAICTPKRPACLHCPWMEDCQARKRGIQEELPRKGEKPLGQRRRPLRQFRLRRIAGSLIGDGIDPDQQLAAAGHSPPVLARLARLAELNGKPMPDSFTTRTKPSSIPPTRACHSIDAYSNSFRRMRL